MTQPTHSRRQTLIAVIGGCALLGIMWLINGPITDKKIEMAIREETRSLSMMPTSDAHTPAFQDASGAPFRLKDFSGKPLVLNIWATWCPPCIKEMPTLAALEKRYEGKIQVIAVSVDAGGFAEIETFFAKHPVAHPRLFHDTNMKLFKHLRLRGLPTTFIINAEGQTVAKMERILKEEDKEVLAVLDALVDTPAPQETPKPDNKN